jgi:hypothetical protein
MTDLNWFGWVLLGVWVLSTLTSVGTIGQPRKPLTPGTAVFVVVFNSLLICGLLFVGTQS